ncbi:hypothetical protein ACFLU5_00245 [Bacteroidota bacterium]
MNLIKLTLGLLIAATIALSGCNKDEDPPDNDNYDGYITFYTKTAGTGCGDITLSLNGTSIGPLSGTTASDPACQADNGPGIITIGVAIGAHDYAASDGCNNIWTGTIIINRGDCKTKELSR